MVHHNRQQANSFSRKVVASISVIMGLVQISLAVWTRVFIKVPSVGFASKEKIQKLKLQITNSLDDNGESRVCVRTLVFTKTFPEPSV